MCSFLFILPTFTQCSHLMVFIFHIHSPDMILVLDFRLTCIILFLCSLWLIVTLPSYLCSLPAGTARDSPLFWVINAPSDTLSRCIHSPRTRTYKAMSTPADMHRWSIKRLLTGHCLACVAGVMLTLNINPQSWWQVSICSWTHCEVRILSQMLLSYYAIIFEHESGSGYRNTN